MSNFELEKAYLIERMKELVRQTKRDNIRFAEDGFHAALHKLKREMISLYSTHGTKLVEDLLAYPGELRRLLDVRDELMEIEAKLKHIRMVENWNKEYIEVPEVIK